MNMPKEISDAIADVMAKVPKLAKGERNTHGGYQFASIDDFLEAIRPLMADAKLVISSDEEDFDVLEAGHGRDGKPRSWLKMRFAFYAHCAGTSYGPSRRSIMIDATMGSQAFGAAQSYAEKQFLRSLFKIATGEGASIDADSYQQASLPKRKGPAPREKLVGKHSSMTALRAAIANARKLVREAPDMDTLKAIGDDYADDIAQAQQYYEWFLTGEPGIEEDIGLYGEVKARKQFLTMTAPVAETGMLGELIASMKKVDNLLDLGDWLETNRPLIDALSDEQGRMFQREYEAKDAALVAEARLNAG